MAGMVAKPKTYEVDELIRLMPVEERLYRHRCVEAWSMAVPWTGFPMKAFIDLAQPLPKQNGAPIRLVTPWKYGYKSIKSIVKIEFTDKQPKTFWNDLAPNEYDFLSNVNPNVPHPRWSQATEQPIPAGPRRPALLYNGYEQSVASLYK